MCLFSKKLWNRHKRLSDSVETGWECLVKLKFIENSFEILIKYYTLGLVLLMCTCFNISFSFHLQVYVGCVASEISISLEDNIIWKFDCIELWLKEK